MYKTIALIGIGYILKDRLNKKSNTYSNYLNPNTLTGHLTQILNDKMDLIFYGKCKWRPAMRDVTRGHGNTYTQYFYPLKQYKQTCVDEILFDSRQDAEDAIIAMTEIIERYGRAVLMDFYDYCKISKSYDDYNSCYHYGWDDLSDAKIMKKTSGKWFISFPKAKYFD